MRCVTSVVAQRHSPVVPRDAKHPPNRLRQLRTAIDGMTQQKLADLVTPEWRRRHPKADDLDRQTIQKLEQSTIPLTHEWMELLAPHLGVEPAEIMSESHSKPVFVQVVGFVGAGNAVENVADPGGGIDQIEAPSSARGTVAVKVRGLSMYPRYDDGTYLFFRHSDGAPDDLVGRECIVQTADGRTLVKQLMRGSRPGAFTLLSHNAPPINDVAVVWASLVLGTWNS